MDPIERVLLEMGQTLTSERKARGISRRRASILSGLSRETIYRLEEGYTRNGPHYRGCTMDTVLRYCMAVGIEFTEFCPTMEYMARVVREEAA